MKHVRLPVDLQDLSWTVVGWISAGMALITLIVTVYLNLTR